MDTQAILDQFARSASLPAEALRAASENRQAVLPIFIAEIESYLTTGDASRKRLLAREVFFIFHLLGFWREKSAYRLIAELLRSGADEIEQLLGYCTTETSHRVAAGVFDGDPRPLEEIIFDPSADEFVRARMIEALAMVTLRGELPREYAVNFLIKCWDELQPQLDCFVWHGWQAAIAMLGLRDLKPLVLRAYARGSIDPVWLSAVEFEEDLQHAQRNGGKLAVQGPDEFELFGDPAVEMAHYDCFRAAQSDRTAPDYQAHGTLYPWFYGLPAVNPHPKTGRNDPCPCGSGRKFKKCCLEVPALAD